MKDFYLVEGNSYERLKREFLEHGKLIFCLDFDDTIFDFHKKGRTYENVVSLIHRWENYSEVIIFTGNGEENYDFIRNYLDEHEIKYKGINCDSSVHVKGRKTYANVYIDDRAGLIQVYNDLLRLIEEIESGEVFMNKFNARKVKDEIVEWIRDWFEENGKECNAVIGISGGKDSSIVATLCVEALGKDRVIGVRMPQGLQPDIDDACKIINHLGIKSYGVNIGTTVDSILMSMALFAVPVSEQAKINLPPRIRMATLYAVSQSVNGRVANTCNLSEDWVGYSTRYGDSVGDFSPLSNLTVTEIKEIGRVLELPDDLIDKTPIDGLCGKTDEENLGFTYEELDNYIRYGIEPSAEKKEKIDRLHEKNLFKLQLMPSFSYNHKN